MVKTIYTNKERRELYERLLPLIATTLKELKNHYNYREIAEMTGTTHTRIVDAANGHYLNETTLRMLIGGEVISLSDIRANVELSKNDLMYLEQLAATANPKILRRLVRILDKYGLNSTIDKLDTLLKPKS